MQQAIKPCPFKTTASLTFSAACKDRTLQLLKPAPFTASLYLSNLPRLLVDVAVMGVGGGHLFEGDDAALDLGAAGVLELDGGVADVEVVAEDVVELEEDTGALGGRYVGDGDVAGEGGGVGTETPDVEVVDVEDAFDLFHAGADGSQRDAAGDGFEKDIEGFADDAEAGPENEGGDDEREGGIDPVAAGEEDAEAAGDDGGGGEGVAGHVEEGAAEVDVAGDAPEEGGDDAVHEDAGGGHVDHEAGMDGDGAGEAMDGFGGDPEGDEDEGAGVDEGGEDAGALVAEGLGAVGGAGLEVDGGEAEQEGEEVGDVVAGFGEEGQGVGAKAGDEGNDDVGQGGDEGDAEYSGRPFGGGGRDRVDMHRASVTGDGYGALADAAGVTGMEMAGVEGVGVGELGQDGQTGAETGPVFGEDDAVLGVAGLVADGAGEAGADLGGVDDGAEGCDVLGAVVDDAADAVVVDEQGESAGVFGHPGILNNRSPGWGRGFDFGDVEEHAVDEAAGLNEELAAGALELFRGGALAKDKPEAHGAGGGEQKRPGGELPKACVAEDHWRRDRHPEGPKNEDTADVSGAAVGRGDGCRAWEAMGSGGSK